MAISHHSEQNVFSRYGEACFRAQHVEQAIENTVWACLKRSGSDGRVQRDKLEGESLGAVFRRVETVFKEIDPVWAGNIRVFVRFRNYISHAFFVDFAAFETNEKLASQALIVLSEFEKACAVASYHLRLISDELGLVSAARFTRDAEDQLARANGVTSDAVLKFKRPKFNA